MISSRLRRAIEFAVIAHQSHKDKCGSPYIIHPFAVALSVHRAGEEAMITALLHDVVEDCGVTLDEIEQKFGRVVRDAVDSVSRRETPVKEIYRDFVQRSKNNMFGRIVKREDLKDNMRPERLECLPVEEQGVVHRYRKALEELDQ